MCMYKMCVSVYTFICMNLFIEGYVLFCVVNICVSKSFLQLFFCFQSLISVLNITFFLNSLSTVNPIDHYCYYHFLHNCIKFTRYGCVVGVSCTYPALELDTSRGRSLTASLGAENKSQILTTRGQSGCGWATTVDLCIVLILKWR